MKRTELATCGDGVKLKAMGALGIAGIAILAPFAAFAQDNAPTLLAMKFKAGETSKYQSVITMSYSLPGFNPVGSTPPSKTTKPQPGKTPAQATPPGLGGGSMTLTQVVKVMKVQKNGAGELQLTSTSTGTLMAIAGQQGSEGKPTVQNIVCDGLGRSTGSQFSSPLTFGSESLNTGGIILPSKPVKPGETWSESQKLPNSTSSIVTKTTFLRYEQVGSRRTAHLRSVTIVPLGSIMPRQGGPVSSTNMQGTMTVTKDSNFAIAEGKVIKSNGVMDMNMVLNMPSAGAATAKGKPAAPPTKMNVVSHITQEIHLVE